MPLHTVIEVASTEGSEFENSLMQNRLSQMIHGEATVSKQDVTRTVLSPVPSFQGTPNGSHKTWSQVGSNMGSVIIHESPMLENEDQVSSFVCTGGTGNDGSVEQIELVSPTEVNFQFSTARKLVCDNEELSQLGKISFA